MLMPHVQKMLVFSCGLWPLPQLIVIELEIVVALIGEAATTAAGGRGGHGIRVVLARRSDIMAGWTVDLDHAEILALHLVELHLAAGHYGHADAKRAILHARVLLAQLESRRSPVVAHNALDQKLHVNFCI